MRWSVMIWEDLPIRVDIVGKHQLFFILCHILVVHYLRSIASASKCSWILLNLKLNLILATLAHLVLNIELPNRILSTRVASLVLGRWHLPWLQIVLAMLWSAILICKLNHTIPVRSRRNRQIRTIIVGPRRLIYLLSRIHISRQLAAELLASWLLAALLLLVVLQLLVAHRIICWTYSFLDNHSRCITASVSLLPESGRVHVATRSPRINRVLFDHLVYAIIAPSLDHGSVLRYHVLASCKLLNPSEIWILWSY